MIEKTGRKRGCLHSLLIRYCLISQRNGGPNRSNKKGIKKKRFKMEVISCAAEDNWVKSGGRLAAILAIETGKKKVRDPLTPLPYPINKKKNSKSLLRSE